MQLTIKSFQPFGLQRFQKNNFEKIDKPPTAIFKFAALFFLIISFIEINAQIGPPSSPMPANNEKVCKPNTITLQWVNPAFTVIRRISISEDPSFPIGKFLSAAKDPAIPGPDFEIFNLEDLGLPTTGKTYYWIVEVWCAKNSHNYTTWQFDNSIPATISGSKFGDMNGNGVWDDGEKGLQGWTIKLSDGQSVVTDTNGVFSFNVTEKGIYTVSEVQKTRWKQTLPKGNDTSVTVSSYGEIINRINFGNRPSNPCSLIYPENDNEFVDVLTEFYWINDEDAITVTLTVSENGTEIISKDFTADPGEEQLYTLLTPLEYLTKYRWNIITHTTTGDIPACDGFIFTTACGPSKKISPADNSKHVELQPTFTWQNSKGSKTVKLLIVGGPNYDINVDGEFQSYKIKDTLQSYRKYDWLLINDCEGLEFGEQPDYFTFLTQADTCMLIFPTNHKNKVKKRPRFSWKDAQDAQAVTFILYQVRDGIDTEIFRKREQSYGGFIPQYFDYDDDLEYSSEYKWKINTHTVEGEEIEGYKWTFYTGCKPPEIMAPLNKSNISTLTPTVVWKNSEGTTKITLAVTSSKEGSNVYLRNYESPIQGYTLRDMLPVLESIVLQLVNDCECQDNASDVSSISFSTLSASSANNSPKDGATNVSVHPTFTYSELPWKLRIWKVDNYKQKHSMQKTNFMGNLFEYDLPADTKGGQVFQIPDTLAYSTKYAWTITCYYDTLEIPSDTCYFETIANPVSVKEEEIPTEYRLEQNFPNPFNPSTIINYYLPSSGTVVLKIFNVIGKEIAMLVNERQPPGYYQVEWKSDHLPSGVYYYSIYALSEDKGKNFYAVKKMLLLK